uniref:Uncharacterized protein n=1 Tax=Panagrolaimus superbus TaxID=310955 RepID=A0A914YHE8_9BILA
MIDRRRAIKQIAPMIFVIRATHGNDYFVSTGDFALKVPGNFGDALHYLTALHYVLYIEYASELLHFNLLLENLCGINMTRMPKSRLNLKLDLETKMQNISEKLNEMPLDPLQSSFLLLALVPVNPSTFG